MFDKNTLNNNLDFLPGNFNSNKVDFLKLAITATGKLEKLNIDYHKMTKLLFSNPFLLVLDFEEKFNITKRTASRYIQKLEENKIVDSVKIGRNKLIFIPEFIELLS